ncbi:MAG: leucine-rich repeat protein [Candidatus Methanoplasma sp.]|jgi:hypothetical protein|nr:leucine-rich repeat protein [Candidatus Methanoplasma sp.]
MISRRNLIVLSAAALFMAAALASMYTESDDSDAVGGNTGKLTWDLTNGVLTISGNGVMPSYPVGGAPWESEKANIKSIVISPGVTSISDYAFYLCSVATSVSIPDGVTIIGIYAFYYCTSLTSANIPGSVLSLGSSAFAGCTGLTSATIQGTTIIGTGVFRVCTALKSVSISDSVKTIGVYAFDGCTSLETVTVTGSYAGTLGIIGKYFSTGKTWKLPNAPNAAKYLTFSNISPLDYGPDNADKKGGIAGAAGRELTYSNTKYAWNAGTSSWDSVVYSVSGTLTVTGGASNVGVEVYLGSLHATTVAGGTYTITGVPYGISGNITASITGYTQTVTPNVSSLAADATGKDITLEINKYSVSGTLTVTGGASNVGVTVSLGSYAAVTAAGGTYTITGVPYGTTGDITASITGYTQTVTPNVPSLTGDLTGQNLTLEINKYSVSGTLTVTGGASDVGVEIYLGSLHATTVTGGAYTISNVPYGTSGNITAPITGYTQTVTPSVSSLTGDLTGQNLTLEINKYSVSGTLTVTGGESNVGVEVYLGSLHATTVTGGAYTISNVPYGTSGNITAAITGHTQTVTPTVPSLTGDLTGQNLTLETNKYTVTLIKGIGIGGFRYSINGGAAAGYTGPFSVEHGSSLAVTALPSEGYAFYEWFGHPNSRDNPLTVSEVTGGISFTASGYSMRHTVTIDSGFNYTVYSADGSPLSSPITATDGESIIFAVRASEGYTASLSVVSGNVKIILQTDGWYKMSDIHSDVHVAVTVTADGPGGVTAPAGGTIIPYWAVILAIAVFLGLMLVTMIAKRRKNKDEYGN